MTVPTTALEALQPQIVCHRDPDSLRTSWGRIGMVCDAAVLIVSLATRFWVRRAAADARKDRLALEIYTSTPLALSTTCIPPIHRSEMSKNDKWLVRSSRLLWFSESSSEPIHLLHLCHGSRMNRRKRVRSRRCSVSKPAFAGRQTRLTSMEVDRADGSESERIPCSCMISTFSTQH